MRAPLQTPAETQDGSSTAVQRLTLLAVFVSLLLATVLPGGYFLAVYFRERGTMGAEAKADSFYISELVSSNPRLWQYQQIRLQDILDRRPEKGVSESRAVYTLDGKVVVEGKENLDPPFMRQRYPVLDAGRPVGAVEIKRSLRPLLFNATFIAFFSVALGEAIFYLIRIMPIRSVRQAEEKSRRYAQELEATNADLRAFIFGIAHDLRSPLVNLLGFSGELRSELAGVMPELRRSLNSLSAEEHRRVVAVLEGAVPEALGFIDASANKLDALVNAILYLSRIDFLKLHPEVINSEELLHATLQPFALMVKENKITVNVGPLPTVITDWQGMEQCFTNLLGNAFKYLEPGRTGVVSVSAEQQKDEVVFCFTDNGRGIAPEDMQKVFDIFRRAGKQDTPGEGMGLAFVKAWARRLGGKVWCESTLGEGSRFYLALPRKGGQQS